MDATEMKNERASLSVMSTDDLKRELLNQLSITAKALIRAATIVSIIESRGETISEVKSGLIGHLRKIAHGQIIPELVVSFAGNPPLLKKLANLPMPDQRRVVQEEGLEIGVVSNGEITHRLKPVLQMEPFEIRQVFADDHIRTPEEQVSWIRTRESKRPQSSIEPPAFTFSADCIIVNRPCRIPFKVVKQAVTSKR